MDYQPSLDENDRVRHRTTPLCNPLPCALPSSLFLPTLPHLLRNAETSLANLFGRAAFGAVDVRAQLFRCHTHRRVLVQALVLPALLVETAAEQTDRGKAGLRLGKAERVGGANAVVTGLAVGAATRSVDVVTQRGANLAGIRLGNLVHTLIVTAFLIRGAAEKAQLGVADGGIREEARIFGRWMSWDAFAVFALEVPGADGNFLVVGGTTDLSIVETVAWERSSA
jgi:hypothetical protein